MAKSLGKKVRPRHVIAELAKEGVTNVRLAPVELNATAIIRNVDLSLAQLYLPSSLPIRPERGVINDTATHPGTRKRVAALRSIEPDDLQAGMPAFTMPAY